MMARAYGFGAVSREPVCKPELESVHSGGSSHWLTSPGAFSEFPEMVFILNCIIYPAERGKPSELMG